MDFYFADNEYNYTIPLNKQLNNLLDKTEIDIFNLTKNFISFGILSVAFSLFSFFLFYKNIIFPLPVLSIFAFILASYIQCINNNILVQYRNEMKTDNFLKYDNTSEKLMRMILQVKLFEGKLIVIKDMIIISYKIYFIIFLIGIINSLLCYK